MAVQAADHITYSEILPDSRLRNFIYCYWQFKTSRPLASPFNHLIVADGCIDIYFDLNNPQESYVMGFSNSYTEFQLETTFNYTGVRFFPAVFPQLFNLNAKEISNRSEKLEHISPAASGFIKHNFNAEMDTGDVKKNLDDYFLRVISGSSVKPDNRLSESLAIILKNRGMVNIEAGLDTGISPRQLRRLFEFYIGDSAKTFSKVVRFQNVLRSPLSSQSLKQNKAFFDAGYYDQAHFIKEFKTFYGITPGKAFGK